MATWRSEADTPLRKRVIDRIRCFFEDRQAHLQLGDAFPNFVKRLELVLYKDAPTKEAYADPATMFDRLKSMATEMVDRTQIGTAPSAAATAGSAFRTDSLLHFQRHQSSHHHHRHHHHHHHHHHRQRQQQQQQQQEQTQQKNQQQQQQQGSPSLGLSVGDDVTTFNSGSSAPIYSNSNEHPASWMLDAWSGLPSEASENGFFYSLDNTWSGSGPSSGFSGPSSGFSAAGGSLMSPNVSIPWLEEDRNLWYTGELMDEDEGGAELESGHSIVDSAGRQQATPQQQQQTQQQQKESKRKQPLNGTGIRHATKVGRGSMYTHGAGFVRRRSCPADFNTRIKESRYASSRKENDLLCHNHIPPLEEDTALWDAPPTLGTLPVTFEKGQQAIGSAVNQNSQTSRMDVMPTFTAPAGIGSTLAVATPSLMGYSDGDSNASPEVVSGIEGNMGGMIPRPMLPSTRGTADVSKIDAGQGLVPASVGSTRFGGQRNLEGMKGVENSTRLEYCNGRLGLSVMNDHYLPERPMVDFSMKSAAEMTQADVKKGPSLAGIPEHVELPNLGFLKTEAQQTRTVSQNAVMAGRLQFQQTAITSSPLSGGGVRNQNWRPTEGMYLKAQAPMVGRDSGRPGVRDELVHAFLCKAAQCSMLCLQLRRLFEHARNCQFRRPECPICKWLGALLSVHFKTCTQADCPLPCCRVEHETPSHD